jgi:hypothetical protein
LENRSTCQRFLHNRAMTGAGSVVLLDSKTKAFPAVDPSKPVQRSCARKSRRTQWPLSVDIQVGSKLNRLLPCLVIGFLPETRVVHQAVVRS